MKPTDLLNVLQSPLQSCCTHPMTGYWRDGLCRTAAEDHGTHIVFTKADKLKSQQIETQVEAC